MKLDLLIAGTAGQGAVTLAKIIVKAALSEGYDAHAVAHSGIAQLGGPVSAHVRVGTPAGASPRIPRGKADAVIGLERLEALKARPFLAPGGVAVVSDVEDLPIGARARAGLYPTIAEIEAAYAPERVVRLEAKRFVRAAHHPAAVGAVALGAIAGLFTVIDRDHLVTALRRELPAYADREVEGFFAGYATITGHDE